MSKMYSKDKTYTVVDNETGEVVTSDARFYGKNPFVDTKFRKVFVGFLSDIVLNEKIAGKAIRLLLWMIENLRVNDLNIYMSERIVCEELGISKMTYFRWVKVLLEENLIEKVDTNLYRLVPFTAVNGQMDRAIKKSYKKEQGNRGKEKEVC